MTATTVAGAERLRADAVVIGSGAGGAPAALVLAEAGREVVVLEAGPRFEAADFSTDEWEMRTRLGRVAISSDALQNFYAGACVGGSTVVNDALCWRPPPEVLETWQVEHGLAALSGSAFAPFVERAWRDIHAEPTPRSLINRNAHRLEVGAHRLGWAGEAMPRNVRGCAGLGRCTLGCPIDAKQSMLVTYVPRAERAGARVLANARVERIRVEAGAVRGVEATRLDPATRAPIGRLQLDAPLVCVAAGVLETGALLQRSGIPGRGATAGAGMQAHSSVYVTARFDEPIHGYFGPTMSWAVTEFSDVNGREGPGYMLENSAVHPMQTAGVLPGFGADHEDAMAAQHAHAPGALMAAGRHRVEGFFDLNGGPVEPPMHCHVVTATGNPDAVARTVGETLAQVVSHRVYRDHHWFRLGEAREEHAFAVSQNAALVLTAKDAVRWPARAPRDGVCVLRVNWEWAMGGARVERRIFEGMNSDATA